jgi:hypothetical protein
MCSGWPTFLLNPIDHAILLAAGPEHRLMKHGYGVARRQDEGFIRQGRQEDRKFLSVATVGSSGTGSSRQ